MVPNELVSSYIYVINSYSYIKKNNKWHLPITTFYTETYLAEQVTSENVCFPASKSQKKAVVSLIGHSASLFDPAVNWSRCDTVSSDPSGCVVYRRFGPALYRSFITEVCRRHM